MIPATSNPDSPPPGLEEGIYHVLLAEIHPQFASGQHELKNGEVQACGECCGSPHGNVQPDVDAPEMAFEFLPGEHVFHELRYIAGDLLAGT